LQEVPTAPHPPASGCGDPESIGGGFPASIGQQELFGWPQLSMQAPPQPVAVQQTLFTQTALPGHVCGHGTDCPQLFVAVTWHRPPQAVVLSGLQHVSFARQVAPTSHSVELLTPQLTVRLQLLTADPHCFPAQVVLTGSGMQPQTPL